MEECFHVSSTFPDRRIVFIENLTILENHTNIFFEFISPFVSESFEVKIAIYLR